MSVFNLPDAHTDVSMPGVIAHAAQRLLTEIDTLPVNGAQNELLREVLRFAAQAEAEIGARQTRIHKLEAASLVDDVTGLDNERSLRAALERSIAAAGRYGTSHVLILLALEGLTEIEDTHGRSIAQFTLQQLATELRRHTRGADIVARTGRHEFAVLLTPCPASHAATKSASLAGCLGALPLRYRDQDLSVQITTGYAAFGAEASVERIFALAHQKLARRWEPRLQARPSPKAGFGRRGLVAPRANSQ